MDWCLTAPSHYLNQCWLIVSGVLCHQRPIPQKVPKITFRKNTLVKLLPHFPEASVLRFPLRKWRGPSSQTVIILGSGGLLHLHNLWHRELPYPPYLRPEWSHPTPLPATPKARSQPVPHICCILSATPWVSCPESHLSCHQLTQPWLGLPTAKLINTLDI